MKKSQPSSKPRDLSKVLDEIMALAPDLKERLAGTRQSCVYQPPEAQPELWNRAAVILSECFADHPKRAEIAAIFSGDQRQSSRKGEVDDSAVADILADAWTEYARFYGQPPHGTSRQLYSMLALKSAGKRIAALFSAPVSESAWPVIELERAAKAVCHLCAEGRPVEFTVCFKGDEPDFYHVGLSRITPGDTLYEHCAARPLRRLAAQQPPISMVTQPEAGAVSEDEIVNLIQRIADEGYAPRRDYLLKRVAEVREQVRERLRDGR